MSLLEVQNVDLYYEGSDAEIVQALDNIQLSINPQDFVVVLGASGCGKTSLLNLLAGFLFPSSGKITMKGKMITAPGVERGVVFQENALMPWLSVKDNIALALSFQKIPKTQQNPIIKKVLEWVDLSDFENHYTYQLSGGMQQRVGIARALAADADIMLMDEPFGALDAITREDIQQLVLKVWEKSQKTVFMITHSIDEALFMGTRLIIMTPRPGRITKHYELDFSRKFLAGETAKNIKKSAEFLKLKSEVVAMIEQESV